MKLRDLLSGCEYEIAASKELQGTGKEKGRNLSFVNRHQSPLFDAEISGIAYDSRKVDRNGVFVAVRGENLDGHDFINDAVKKGAVAIVHEELLASNELRVMSEKQGENASQVFIKVDDSRRALACIANNFCGRPSETISVVGVTGTNGKTTTSYLIKAVLEAWEKRVGLIGTITYIIGDRNYPALHTTPEALEFQGLLREMARAGCSHAVAEVSSHSLSLKRVDYTRFVVVVFTNLTRDHLDFHETMENYYSAKERLFTGLLSGAGTAVINVDDEWGRRLLDKLKGSRGSQRDGDEGPFIITYGIEREADVSASERQDTPSGVSFTVTCMGRAYRIDSSLIGTPNVYNILAATAVGIALNVPMKAIQEGIRNAAPVKGRLEKVDAGQDFLCIIDYAHTPDALERLILTARTLLKNKDRPGRIITLFGCGGDRDRGKRAVMGEIAARLSDYVIITSDNPRSEDPGEIMKEIASGIRRDNYRTVPDRREAITVAVETAGTGDVLLIAGKGHEDYQEIRGMRRRFSDREVAGEAIKNRLKGKLS
jgi:UDP-N-acetylmuramoyl-L-alanyl-D-glutamate--2,6-diaminopimelate ligase